MKTRKLLLKLDDLRVETFAAAEHPADAWGTVRAAEGSRQCDSLECDTQVNCPPSFQPTCGIVPATFEVDCMILQARPQTNACEYSFDLPCCV